MSSSEEYRKNDEEWWSLLLRSNWPENTHCTQFHTTAASHHIQLQETFQETKSLRQVVSSTNNITTTR
jgi:hypothetical protein